MFTVRVQEISPAGVHTERKVDYYESFDALTVAEIELRNALIPTGRVREFDYFSTDYVVEGRYGERVTISVLDDEGHKVTLRRR